MWVKAFPAAACSGNAIPSNAAKRPRQDRTPSMVRVVGALAVGLLLLGGTGPASLAKENKTVSQGLAACDAWCDTHNRPGSARAKCRAACYVYWVCNGSNAMKAECEASGGTWAELTPLPGGQTPGGLRRNLPLSTTPLAPAQ